ncbi:MAG: Fe-S cluster assembly protein SufB, partial [Alphaproteobacteria bacterium]
MVATTETVETVEALEGGDKYKYGWSSDVESDFAPKGLNEDIVRFISEAKGEPEWLLEWRLEAFARWLQMEEPEWANVKFPPIDYQDAYYFARPKSMKVQPKSIDDVDPALIDTYNKLGIPLEEQKILAGVEGYE